MRKRLIEALAEARDTLDLAGPVILYALLIALSAWLLALAPDYPFPEDRFDWTQQ